MQHDDDTTPDDTAVDGSEPTDAGPAPTDAAVEPVASEDDGGDKGGDEADVTAAEPEPPSDPPDATPTPLAAPSEGPIGAAGPGSSGAPRPVASKVTPVLAVVAVAWLLRKLLSRRRR